MPVGNWQFWVVSLLALAAGWIVVKPFLPRRRRGARRRVDLTVERRRRG